jgi:hypothetical protein
MPFLNKINAAGGGKTLLCRNGVYIISRLALSWSFIAIRPYSQKCQFDGAKFALMWFVLVRGHSTKSRSAGVQYG